MNKPAFLSTRANLPRPHPPSPITKNPSLELAVSRAAQWSTSCRKDRSGSRARGLHPQVATFLKKNFRQPNAIPLSVFLSVIVRQHPDIFDEQGEHVIEDMGRHFRKALNDGENNVDLCRLATMTAGQGVLGLILNSLKEINSGAGKQPQLQNLKNVIQEFVEGLVKRIQNEIYSKYNMEMRRLVLKTKEAEDLLRGVNNIITQNYTAFSQKHKEGELQARIAQLQSVIAKVSQQNANLTAQVYRLSLKNRQSEVQSFDITTYRRHTQSNESQKRYGVQLVRPYLYSPLGVSSQHPNVPPLMLGVKADLSPRLKTPLPTKGEGSSDTSFTKRTGKENRQTMLPDQFK